MDGKISRQVGRNEVKRRVRKTRLKKRIGVLRKIRQDYMISIGRESKTKEFCL